MKLISYIYEEAKTLYDGFRRGARVSSNSASNSIDLIPSAADLFTWIYRQRTLFGMEGRSIPAVPVDEL
jgi:hypothetical protein